MPDFEYEAKCYEYGMETGVYALAVFNNKALAIFKPGRIYPRHVLIIVP